jgi:hypothetical protein
MTLQNRVLPDSRIVALANYRGMLMGNRGCLHDDQQQLVRQTSAVKRWILCVTEFKGRRRTPMTPRLYTELFFLDEATGLAAGHRPCFECRRADAQRFKAAWIAGNPQFGLPADSSIDRLDRHLHTDRCRLADEHKLTAADLGELPSGVIVAEGTDGSFYLLMDQRLHRWTETGYQPAEQAQPSQPWRVVTPPTTVNAIRSGYSPTIHPSIDKVCEPEHSV